MLEPWNDKSILSPPVNTSANINFDIKNVKHVCNSIIHVLSKQSPLHKESAIFSRFLYKFDKKFRNDIGYRYFKKVNSTLRKYLNLTIIKDIQNFMNVLPANNENTIFAPTRQMLEYVLIRIITFSKLMFRITMCSKQAAVFYFDRIKRGESQWMSLMPFALLSRIWSMGLVLLQHSCNWYTQLSPVLNQLEYKGLHFLPDKCVLPSNLEDWIDMKFLNNAGRFEWSQKLTSNFDSIIDDDEEGLCENILKFADKINSKNKDTEPDPEPLLPKNDLYVNDIFKQSNDDQGVAISRENFKKFMNNLPPILVNPTVDKVMQDHCIENVSDKKSLNEFLHNEETYRNTSEDKCLTRHLTFMQWQSLKNILLNSSLVNQRKLKMKVQKIWKEKCLEYI